MDERIKQYIVLKTKKKKKERKICPPGLQPRE